MEPLEYILETYYPNKKIKSKGRYYKGLKRGFFEKYHANGVIKSKANFTIINNESQLHNGYTEYYKDGKIKTIGSYSNGKRRGIWQHYDIFGTYTIKNYAIRKSTSYKIMINYT